MDGNLGSSSFSDGYLLVPFSVQSEFTMTLAARAFSGQQLRRNKDNYQPQSHMLQVTVSGLSVV